MSHAQGGKMDEGLQVTAKLMEIATVRTATEQAAKIYLHVKDRNILFRTWSWTAETGFAVLSTGVRPLVKSLNGPIKVADAVACTIVDAAQNKFPIILETPGNILTTSCATIINTSGVQLVMSGTDKLLFIAEKIVTLLPEFSVDEMETEESDDEEHVETHVNSVLNQIKAVYEIVTMPLQITGLLIKKSRKMLNTYKKETPVKNERKQPGIVARFTHLPLKGLHFIGMLAEKRSILYRQRHSELKIKPEACNEQLESVEKQFLSMESHGDEILEESSDTDSIENVSFDSLNSTRASSQTSPTEFFSASEVKTIVNSTSRKPTLKIVKPVTPLRKKVQKVEGSRKTNVSVNTKVSEKFDIRRKDSSSRKTRSLTEGQRSNSVQTKPTRPRPRVGSE